MAWLSPIVAFEPYHAPIETAFPEPSGTSHRTPEQGCQTESSSPRHGGHDRDSSPGALRSTH